MKQAGKKGDMKETKFVIRLDAKSKLWLDGFDGQNWDWIADRKRAWRFDEKEAKDKLQRLSVVNPYALIETA